MSGPKFGQFDTGSETDREADGWLSENAIRKQAEARSYPVTHAQFQRFVAVGLLPDRSERGWQADAADRVIRIRELGRTVDSLARRVVILRSELPFWDVPPDKLRRAMIKVIPTITRPAAKMRRVEDAIAFWWQQQNEPFAFYRGRSTGRIPWKKQATSQWQAILGYPAIDTRPHSEQSVLVDGSPTISFDQRSGFAYSLAMSGLPGHVRGTPYDLNGDSAIPFEEQVILLTVRDLAASLENLALAEKRRAAEASQAERDEDGHDWVRLSPTHRIARGQWEDWVRQYGLALAAGLPHYAKYFKSDGFDQLRQAMPPVQQRVFAEAMTYLDVLRQSGHEPCKAKVTVS